MRYYWQFDELRYYEDSQLLVRVDGTSALLRQQLHTLLLIFLQHSQQLLTKSQLIRQVWGEVSKGGAGDEDLRSLKEDLQDILGNKRYIGTVRGRGYVLRVPARRVAEEHDTAIGVALPVDILLPGSSSEDRYFASWVDYGANDLLLVGNRPLKRKGRPDGCIPLSKNEPLTLSISFRHSIRRNSTENSWWAVGISISANPLKKLWQPVDLSRYEFLDFRARVLSRKSPRGVELRQMMRVRFEDDSTEGKGGNRQATSWSPEAVVLGAQFRKIRLALDKFDWSRRAWSWNTKPVDRMHVVQLVLGHDLTVNSMVPQIWRVPIWMRLRLMNCLS